MPDFINTLRDTLGYSTADVNFISTLTNVGTWISLPGGLLYDR